MSEQREVKAPEGYTFGIGRVLMAPLLESEAPFTVGMHLQEVWGDAMPVGEVCTPEHPQYLASETPQWVPENTTTLWFENQLGLHNFIHELIALYACRYPGEELPGVTAEVVEQIKARKLTPITEALFAPYLAQAHA